MTKNFKIVAIAIIALGALLFLREKKLVGAQKERSKKYAAERAQAQKKATDKFAAYESKIAQNEAFINNCLAKVKDIKLQIVQEETDILIASIEAIGNQKKDSAERATADDKSVLSKLNTQNTIIIYFNKLETPQLNLKSEIRQLLSDNYYSSKINTCTDIQTSDKDKAIARAAGVQYIVAAQPEKMKRGKIKQSKEFESGYLILKYEVYDITTGKQIKNSSMLATNSESLYSMRSADIDVMLYQDLMRQGNKAVAKTVYGNTNL